MIAIMWQFEVKAGRETEFEQLYGADGAWTAVNRHTRSYLGSSFLNDQNRASRYIVIEYWSEMLVSEPARRVHSTAAAAFEAQRTALIESVEPTRLSADGANQREDVHFRNTSRIRLWSTMNGSTPSGTTCPVAVASTTSGALQNWHRPAVSLVCVLAPQP